MRRRLAASASRARVSSFSSPSSSSRAAFHSCGDTTGGIFMVIWSSFWSFPGRGIAPLTAEIRRGPRIHRSGAESSVPAPRPLSIRFCSRVARFGCGAGGGSDPLRPGQRLAAVPPLRRPARAHEVGGVARSEEHTSELQSRQYLVCRLLLEKKKRKQFLSPSRT